MSEKPTRYELQIIEEIKKETPKKPKNIFSNFLDNMNDSLSKASAWISNVPGIETILNQVQGKMVNMFQDFSKKSYDNQSVMDRYAEVGFPQIQSTNDITSLTLEEVEQVAGGLRKKYQTLAENSEEENESDASDIIALITLNQKAISEYAAAYGFDINLEQERLFALNIMEYAAAEESATRAAVLERMMKMAKDVASQGDNGKQISKPKFLDTIRTMSGSITIRLLKAKVGEVIPLAGAVIGGGFNAYFTHEVSDIAQLIYRKRFLLEKYGEDVFEIEEGKKKGKKEDDE